MKHLVVILLFLLAPLAKANDSFTLYLVRHAEKLTVKDDPALTQCGKLRAKQIASMLAKTKIEKVYSTSYKRTMATAAPFAKQQQLAIKNYSPANLEQFSQQLLMLKESALIVGHSNTTPQLAQLLSGENVETITEKDYRGLYQVQVNDSSKNFTLLMQPLTCQ
jgi:phosphohistidine phosphatase SixA